MAGGDWRYSSANKIRIAESQKRRERALMALAADPTRSRRDICTELGVTVSTWEHWMARFPEFRADVATIRLRSEERDPAASVADGNSAVGKSFVEQRYHYFGYTTPWFQERTVTAYENAKPGDIILVLMPPEHGKTSLTEDDLSIAIAKNPNIRITCVSEGRNMARKISNRIMKRMSLNTPARNFLLDYGPFEPQTGEAGMKNRWAVDAWSVYRSQHSDERDYTFAVGGWSTAIAGTRADRLHVDDIQSLRSADLTAKMWDTFRQDMLSRPGERGHTTLNGTRVRDDDIYDRIDREFRGESFYTKIEYPAILLDHVTQEPKPLWEYDPETGAGYTLEQLEQLRKKVGEDAWWRNYMQQPRSRSFVVFTDETVAKCINPLRGYQMARDQLPYHNPDAWISVDPSIGGRNVVCAVHPDAEALVVLDMQEDIGLTNNAEIAERIDQVARRISGLGWSPSMLVIEAMAFQKGLMNDESILRVAKQWGMRIESHLTGMNKYDENTGVPAMAASAAGGHLDLAYLDTYDQHVTDAITAQMQAWKPYRDGATGQLKFKRGNQLRQDQLMALWFLWIWWTELRSSSGGQTNPEAFTIGGMPFAPTRTGLLVPNR